VLRIINDIEQLKLFATQLAYRLDWIEQCPCQHSIGYMGDGFYRSKDPSNSIKVLKEQIVHRQIKHTTDMNTKHNKSPSLH